jgi:hypothetical protein
MIDMTDKIVYTPHGHRHDSASARPGEASERARVWHALLLLPTSQVVHRWSNL